MVNHCVCGGCTNSSRSGHRVFRFPNKTKDAAIFRAWVRFVQLRRRDFTSASVSKNAVVCSAHFRSEDYRAGDIMECNMGYRGKNCVRLRAGAIPWVHAVPPSSPPGPSSSACGVGATTGGKHDDRGSVRNLRRKRKMVKDLPLLTSGQSSLTKTKSTQTPERIQANPESDRRCHKTIIDIGSAFALWQKFRDENGFKTDTELAFYLLSRTGCCADLSARRKKRKLELLTDVPTHLQMEEYESDSSQPSKDYQCTNEDEDMEVSEICYEVPPQYHTNEPAEIETRSEDQLRSEDRIKSESQIKSEDQSVAPALNNKDIVPECSTSIIKIEIKEEPVETEVQPENRLEISMDSVTTSDKITQSFVQTVNSVSVQVKEEHTEGPLVPNKTHFTGLFRTCVQCGEPMQEYTTGSSWSLNQLQWKCSNGHLMCLFSNNNPTQTHLS
ncbi:uncharacterized protein [Paramisgurnus dabryanus]|uniref:uncharacterized protein n=1 Tax=Paramisgurnus dabryanus TaxID=90735 RepID=UPI0031F44428